MEQNCSMAMHTCDRHGTYSARSNWIALSIALLTLGIAYAAEPSQYPEDFRRWVHVGTAVIMPGGSLPEGEQGMHHILANQKAIAGYPSGEYADGSILVYELRDAPQKNGVITEGERRRVDVMIKDSRLYGSTGGWRFERFWGNDRSQDAILDSGRSCFACHANVKAHGFVFSQMH